MIGAFARHALVVLFCGVVVATLPSGYNPRPVPTGRYAHQSCIHRVPDGAAIRRVDSQHLEVRTSAATYRLPSCSHPLIDVANNREPEHGAAWIVDAVQEWAVGYSFFGTDFSVPEPPANTDVLLYYWPGTEDEAMSDVVQPVLQFGVSPEGGGNYWAYQSWFVGNDGTVLVGQLLGPLAVHSPLNGSIAQTGSQYTAIGFAADGTSSQLSIDASQTNLQTRAYITLEIYEIGGDCTKIPPDNSLVFSNLKLIDSNGLPVAPNFLKEYQNPTCGSDVDLDNAGSAVTIVWKSTAETTV